jgi:hypothetical protein
MKRDEYIDKNVCQTIRPGKHCMFWENTKHFKGCAFMSGTCYPIIDRCKGCSHAEDVTSGSYCSKYASPEASWAGGNCNLATHLEKAEVEKAKFVDPLKASKRAASGR